MTTDTTKIGQEGQSKAREHRPRVSAVAALIRWAMGRVVGGTPGPCNRSRRGRRLVPSMAGAWGAGFRTSAALGCGDQAGGSEEGEVGYGPGGERDARPWPIRATLLPLTDEQA